MAAANAAAVASATNAQTRSNTPAHKHCIQQEHEQELNEACSSAIAADARKHLPQQQQQQQHAIIQPQLIVLSPPPQSTTKQHQQPALGVSRRRRSHASASEATGNSTNVKVGELLVFDDTGSEHQQQQQLVTMLQNQHQTTASMQRRQQPIKSSTNNNDSVNFSMHRQQNQHQHQQQHPRSSSSNMSTSPSPSSSHATALSAQNMIFPSNASASSTSTGVSSISTRRAATAAAVAAAKPMYTPNTLPMACLNVNGPMGLHRLPLYPESNSSMMPVITTATSSLTTTAPATSTKSTSLSPNSTREFLASLAQNQNEFLSALSSASPNINSNAANSSNSTTTKKKFNVTRVTEPPPPSSSSSAFKIPAAFEEFDNKVHCLVETAAARDDDLMPIISSSKTLADYRPSGGANTTNDLSPSSGLTANINNTRRSTRSERIASGAAGTLRNVSVEEADPFLHSSAYQHPQHQQQQQQQQLRRSQRTRSEYLPQMPSSSSTSAGGAAAAANAMLAPSVPSLSSAGNNAPPGSVSPSLLASALSAAAAANTNNNSAISGAIRSSTAVASAAALLTGSPMSTLPYRTPSKTPRYLPISIQSAGYAPTTMEMKYLPPLGNSDSHKHLDDVNLKRQQQGGHSATASNNNKKARGAAAAAATVTTTNSATNVPISAISDFSVHVASSSSSPTSPTAAMSHQQQQLPFESTRNNNILPTNAQQSNISNSSGIPDVPSTQSPGPLTASMYQDAVPDATTNVFAPPPPAVSSSKMRWRKDNSAKSNNAAAATASNNNANEHEKSSNNHDKSFSVAHGLSHFGGVGNKKRTRARLLQRTGNYNMIGKNIPHRRIRLVSDIWNTLVDLQWRYILLLFLLSYFLTWTLFAFIYWIISLSHGDLYGENLNSADWRPCVQNLRSFTTAYLFSVESQHTIGYGYRYITDECAEAIIFLCLQSAIGAAIQAFMTGLVFTKVQRPTKRAQTLLFSRHAVICTRDGQLCLLFRVGNMRRSLIIQSSVTAQLVHHRKTIEGELLPFHQHEMHIQLDSMSSSAFLAWPMTACHIINDESPLYDLDKQLMQSARFELIVTLEGVIESTGQTLQARTSYLPEEILWGFRFAKLLSYRQSSGQYVVNFERFHEVEPARETPVCSAAQLEVLKRQYLARQSLGENENNNDDAVDDDGDDDNNNDDDDDDADAAAQGYYDAEPQTNNVFVEITADSEIPDDSERQRVRQRRLLQSQHSVDTEDLSNATDAFQQAADMLLFTAPQQPTAVVVTARSEEDDEKEEISGPYLAHITSAAGGASTSSPLGAKRQLSQQLQQQQQQQQPPSSSENLPVLFFLGGGSGRGTLPSVVATSDVAVNNNNSNNRLRLGSFNSTAQQQTSVSSSAASSANRHASDADLQRLNQQQQSRNSSGRLQKPSLQHKTSVDNSGSGRTQQQQPKRSSPATYARLAVQKATQRGASHSSFTANASDPNTDDHDDDADNNNNDGEYDNVHSNNRTKGGSAAELHGGGGIFDADERDEAALVLTSPENRTLLNLLKRELPATSSSAAATAAAAAAAAAVAENQQKLRRRKPSTNRPGGGSHHHHHPSHHHHHHHGGSDGPAQGGADAYEDHMARWRRLGSILADPKYTFDLTTEADDVSTTSNLTRPLKTHARLDPEHRLSRVQQHEPSDQIISEDYENDQLQQQQQHPPSYSYALSTANLQPGENETTTKNTVLPPSRVQSDGQLLYEDQLDSVHVQNEVHATKSSKNLRKSVGAGGSSSQHYNTQASASVQHAEMGRRSSASAAVATGGGKLSANATKTSTRPRQLSRHERGGAPQPHSGVSHFSGGSNSKQSRHSSVKRQPQTVQPMPPPLAPAAATAMPSQPPHTSASSSDNINKGTSVVVFASAVEPSNSNSSSPHQ